MLLLVKYKKSKLIKLLNAPDSIVVKLFDLIKSSCSICDPLNVFDLSVLILLLSKFNDPTKSKPLKALASILANSLELKSKCQVFLADASPFLS